MKETALFVGWGGVYPGRELRAFEGFYEWVKILEDLKQKGGIEDFINVSLAPNGGDLDGFTLVFGDEIKLMELSVREDVHRLQLQAGVEFARFSIIPAITGKRLEHDYRLLQEEILPTFEPAHL